MQNGVANMRQHTDRHITFGKARRFVLLSLCLGLVVLAPSLAHAATLENPSGGLFYSGIGVISGWKCEANGELTVRFNGWGPDSPGVRQRAARCPRSRCV